MVTSPSAILSDDYLELRQWSSGELAGFFTSGFEDQHDIPTTSVDRGCFLSLSSRDAVGGISIGAWPVARGGPGTDEPFLSGVALLEGVCLRLLHSLAVPGRIDSGARTWNAASPPAGSVFCRRSATAAYDRLGG